MTQPLTACLIRSATYRGVPGCRRWTGATGLGSRSRCWCCAWPRLLARARSKLALERLVIKKGGVIPGEQVHKPFLSDDTLWLAVAGSGLHRRPLPTAASAQDYGGRRRIVSRPPA